MEEYPPYRSVLAPRIGGIMQVPPGYWADPKNVKDNLNWLVKKEKIYFDDIPRSISIPLLKDNNLHGLVSYYKGSTFKIVNAAYPGKFYIWQFRHNGNRIWTNEDGTPNYELCRKATKWLVQEKFEIGPWLSGTLRQKEFERYGLGGMLCLVYHGSPRQALDDAYPDALKKYHKLPNGFWKSKDGLRAAIRAVQRLVKRREIPVNEIPLRLTFDIFREENLEVIVRAVPSESHIDLIMAAYPHFKRSDFPNYKGKSLFSKKPTKLEKLLAEYRIKDDGSVVSLQSAEGKEIALKLVRELMREENIAEKEAPKKLTKELFRKHDLLELYRALGGSMYNVLTNVFPEMGIKPWQAEKAPEGYWCGPDGMEHAKEATKWLIEEKLKIPLEKIPKRIHQRDFDENGLNGMIHLFNGSVYRAIDNAYLEMFNEWEIRQTNMWQGDSGKELGKKAVRWLVDYLDLRIEELPKKLRRHHFLENGLYGCLEGCFSSSLYNAISETFPEIPKEELAWMRKKTEHFRKNG
ncbi:MAG: hypothetical protein V1900_02045 [Candidatus Aenigmatarchaeota archaeon]